MILPLIKISYSLISFNLLSPTSIRFEIADTAHCPRDETALVRFQFLAGTVQCDIRVDTSTIGLLFGVAGVVGCLLQSNEHV